MFRDTYFSNRLLRFHSNFARRSLESNFNLELNFRLSNKIGEMCLQLEHKLMNGRRQDGKKGRKLLMGKFNFASKHAINLLKLFVSM